VNREERSITMLTRIMEYVNAGYMNGYAQELSALESLNMCYLSISSKTTWGCPFSSI
jgi:hypothetical protein